jgi:GNAT superfamily N-acetyltransferase
MLNRIVDFVMKYIKYNDRNRIREYLEKHIEFGTFDYAVDGEGNIVGCVRFNVSEDGLTMDIFDFSVDEKWRRKGVGKDLLLRGLERFPDVKYLRFQRVIRGDDRFRTLPIDQIIKRNIL